MQEIDVAWLGGTAILDRLGKYKDRRRMAQRVAGFATALLMSGMTIWCSTADAGTSKWSERGGEGCPTICRVASSGGVWCPRFLVTDDHYRCVLYRRVPAACGWGWQRVFACH